MQPKFNRLKPLLLVSLLLAPTWGAGIALAGVRIGDQPLTYRPVVEGDSLWSISRSVMPTEGVTQAQLMVSVLRHNPDAFEQGNAFFLHKGAVLTLPSLAEVRAEDAKQAEVFYARQEQVWLQGGQTAGLPLYALPDNPARTAEVTPTSAPVTPAPVTEIAKPAPSAVTPEAGLSKAGTPAQRSTWGLYAFGALLVLVLGWVFTKRRRPVAASAVTPDDLGLQHALAEAYREIHRDQEAQQFTSGTR